MKLQFDDGILVYENIGSGVPLMLIHGYPLSRKIWNPQVPALSDIASLILMDLRGHGESSSFPGSYSMDLLAEDCKKIIEDLQINTPLVIGGLSMGGYITMVLYRKYPLLFKGMILTSTKAGSDSDEAKAKREESIKDVQEKGVGFIADSMLTKMLSPNTYTSHPDLVKSVYDIMAGTSREGVIGALHAMKERPDSTKMLPQISCPVLIIHGVDDQLIPLKEAEKMSEEIPNAKLIKIPRAGHLSNLEQPEKYNQALIDFISSIS